MHKFITFLVRNKVAGLVISLVLILLVYFLGGTSHQLFSPDEARYVGIAGSQVANGDWLVTPINGVPFFHKPPLFYWLTILGIEGLGHNLVAYRLASIIASLVIIFAWARFLAVTTSSTFARVALITLAFSLPIWLGSQYANTDQLVAAMITATILLGVETAIKMRAGKSYTLVLTFMYVFAGLGLLAKGLIGIVLPGAVILAWLILTGNARFAFKFFTPKRIIAFIVLVLLPLIFIEFRHPGYLYYFFVEQQFLRFLAKGTFNNVNPWWFYLPLVVISAIPWILTLFLNRQGRLAKIFASDISQAKNPTTDSILTVATTSDIASTTATTSVVTSNSSINSKSNTRVATEAPISQVVSVAVHATTKDLVWLCVLWLVIILTFFSIPASKLVGYALPLVSPMVMLCLVLIYHNYQKLNLDFDLFITQAKSSFSYTIVAMMTLFAIVYVGIYTQQVKLLRSSYNLINKDGKVFSLAGVDPQKVSIYSFGTFPYAFQLFYNYYQPLHIVLDINNPEVRSADTWRKEIIDGLQFKPEMTNKAFIAPKTFFKELCDPQSVLRHQVQVQGFQAYLLLNKSVFNNYYAPNSIQATLIATTASYSNKNYRLIALTPSLLTKLTTTTGCKMYQPITTTVDVTLISEHGEDTASPVFQTPVTVIPLADPIILAKKVGPTTPVNQTHPTVQYQDIKPIVTPNSDSNIDTISNNPFLTNPTQPVVIPSLEQPVVPESLPSTKPTTTPTSTPTKSTPSTPAITPPQVIPTTPRSKPTSSSDKPSIAPKQP